MLYIVKGWMTLTIENYDHHLRRRNKKTVRVDNLAVNAKGIQDAIDHACSLTRIEHGHDLIVDACWDGEPDVAEAPQDVAMARLPRDIAPFLPGVETALF